MLDTTVIPITVVGVGRTVLFTQLELSFCCAGLSRVSPQSVNATTVSRSPNSTPVRFFQQPNVSYLLCVTNCTQQRHRNEVPVCDKVCTQTHPLLQTRCTTRSCVVAPLYTHTYTATDLEEVISDFRRGDPNVGVSHTQIAVAAVTAHFFWAPLCPQHFQ